MTKLQVDEGTLAELKKTMDAIESMDPKDRLDYRLCNQKLLGYIHAVAPDINASFAPLDVAMETDESIYKSTFEKLVPIAKKIVALDMEVTKKVPTFKPTATAPATTMVA